tara:strand:- start:23 stop:169 length:147 start_codon:yes stop_codon:yes gene_type:complete
MMLGLLVFVENEMLAPGVIRNTPGAIGYVNQFYISGEVKAVALQNLSG